MTNKKPILILIAGGGSAGKSTLSKKVAEYFENISIIGVDDYTSIELRKGVPWKTI